VADVLTHCECRAIHQRKRIVLTGGPGAGKTAILELIHQALCSHVRVLPESAGILFSGGFPRGDSPELLRAAQRAIFYVQRELENSADSGNPAIVLCDRGTVDSGAYWPGPGELWPTVGTSLHDELRRYDAVIHLRTPSLENGYNHQNPLRTETASFAAAIDAKLASIWAGHPRRFVIEASPHFLEKAERALEVLRAELPECCRNHAESSPGVGEIPRALPDVSSDLTGSQRATAGTAREAGSAGED
jgi:predicted ATPase